MVQRYRFGLFILFVILVTGCDRNPKIPFDRNKWQASDSICYQMLDDLMESKLILNKRPDEVTSILGKADYRWDSLGRWQYAAGSARIGLGFGFYSLHIKFKDGLADSMIVGERID
jgi:hypothetical protein